MEKWSFFSRLSSLIVLPHSVFALPFAGVIVVVLQERGLVSLNQVMFILLAIVTARTAAMTFNRIVDVNIDRVNPRTANRDIPSGAISVRSAYLVLFVSTLLFGMSSAVLGMHCLILSPLVLLILFGYSFLKRFSSWCHFALGVALGLAPGGAWYAITGQVSFEPIPLMLGVVFWVLGFDILYSCQDEQFDRQNGLHSLPVKFGQSIAQKYSRLSHLTTIILLLASGFTLKQGLLYFVGVAFFAALLFDQHRVVIAQGISSINSVFFTRNGVASVLLFLFALADSLI